MSVIHSRLLKTNHPTQTSVSKNFHFVPHFSFKGLTNLLMMFTSFIWLPPPFSYWQCDLHFAHFIPVRTELTHLTCNGLVHLLLFTVKHICGPVATTAKQLHFEIKHRSCFLQKKKSRGLAVYWFLTQVKTNTP